MCKIGDIILISNFIGDGNNNVKSHYFVVVNDEAGSIEGLDFDIVGAVMSSFKNEEHKRKKLRYEENLEITENDGVINNHNLKDGYIKNDQLHYFNKNTTNYLVVGQIDGDVLIKILQLMQYLDTKGKLKQNIENLKDTADMV